MPPSPGAPKRKLRSGSTMLVSISCMLSLARYFRIGSMPVCSTTAGLKKTCGEREVGRGVVAVVVEELDVVADGRVAEAVGGRREFVGDAGVHRRVVAAVGRQRVVAEQRRQEFVVGDRLNLADDDGAGGLEDLLVGPGRMRGRDAESAW